MPCRRTTGRISRSSRDALRATRNLLLLSISTILALAQAGPALAGPFTDAGHPPSSMWAWATAVDEVVRGPLDIAAPGGGDASFGIAENVLGEATGDTLDTLSLGDGGSITLHFDSAIRDEAGDDFAVYENGFLDLFGLFAELAYVEVSTDGFDYARFDSAALNATPVLAFDSLDPTDYDGLAGRHEAGLGTGFDLSDLDMHPLVLLGTVDLSDIRYVRLVDVVGNGSTMDGGGNPIYDPYATPFAQGGFDLEAVGVIHVPEPGLVLGLIVGILGLALAGRPRNRERITRRAALLAASLAITALASPAAALVASFDDLGLGSEAYLNGSTLPGGYTSGGIFFENDYNASFGSFQGFAASTTTDTTTPGFGNQFSNITGSGSGGSAGFGLAFDTGRIVLPSLQIVLGADFTNTTYAALSMLNGDMFTDPFGGPSGDEPDLFSLHIEGIDDLGASTGMVEFVLADYRFANNALDYVVDDWIFQDLTSLGLVKELHFSLESTDVSVFDGVEYLNTPAYFAIDNLTTIPEPGTALLIALGLAGLASKRRDAR